MSLGQFHPATARWFSETLGEPTAVQLRGWGAIAEGRHTLIAAPTGSGKTLAAFLVAIDDLLNEGLRAALPDEVRVVYVSPLKALSTDIHKNLAEPRRGVRRMAAALGLEPPRISAAVRTGDTTQAERAAMLRHPPHILVTTPESLYLLLTAERSRAMLRTVRTVIIDEIHAVIGTRRGAHLSLSLERLQQVAQPPLVRLGLSATQKPVEEVARFLVGTGHVDQSNLAACTIVDEGHRRAIDLALEIPGSPLEAVMSHEVWEEYYDRLTTLIAAHRTTLVFVNTRRLAERLARHLSDRLGADAVTAHHGSLSKDKRLDAEMRLKDGRLRALVATASLELGIDIGHVDLVCQIGSPHRIGTLLQRVGRSGHTLSGVPKGRLFPISRDDLVECLAIMRSIRQGELDRVTTDDRPLDVLTQQLVAECSCREYGEDELFRLARRAWPYRQLTREDFAAVVKMSAEGFSTRRGRRGALVHRDEIQGRVRGRRGSRLLALTSGGAIPEVADYRVILDPDDTLIGTLNEDFAIESMGGDVFQLGNASWRVLRVGAGVVRVAAAKGAPPNIPFWLGEAPARSDELSRGVSDLRRSIEERLGGDDEAASRAVGEWLSAETGSAADAAEQAVAYLAETRRALGVVPTQDPIVLERFFDESGGMQLVLHAPFGRRVMSAWGLALRKRFCRQFNFELQAAATEEALLLSLGPQHSFPLADVFRYLNPATVRDVLVQALLDAPVFQTRWRWNTTISLAVPRNRNGRKVPPQLQRMLADDLMAAVFPDAAACLENIPGDRQVPDHPLVNQTVRDCLEGAMDFDALRALLERIHDGHIVCVARDVPEPSLLSHEILTARPYAFLDDAPLEERRTQAVSTRRAGQSSESELGILDPAAIAEIRRLQQPDPRDADELHDALLTVGCLGEEELRTPVPHLFEQLAAAGRAARTPALWIAAERLPEFSAIHPEVNVDPAIAAPASRSIRTWSRDEAIGELLRGRLTIAGPIDAAALGRSIGIGDVETDAALQALESDGVVLRGSFTPGSTGVEWCDRALLARIHRLTMNRLRAEIEPVSPADFMRFLFGWQHLDSPHRLAGPEGLRSIVELFDGFEVPARAWEQSMLPGRIAGYEPTMLDMSCLTGEIGWARLSMPPPTEPIGRRVVGATPIALFLSHHSVLWRTLSAAHGHLADGEERLVDSARQILDLLRLRGAAFFRELVAASGLSELLLWDALHQLVTMGLVTSDGFAGLRAVIRTARNRQLPSFRQVMAVGRWSAIAALPAASVPSLEIAIEAQARALLRRYGVVFRRLITRETNAVSWRQLTGVYRRLEARGEVRGGRFVSGMSGEQFALPDAVARLREVRRCRSEGQLVVVSGADPLNLAGVVTAGDRVRTNAATRIVYRDGIPLAVMEGDYVRQLERDVQPLTADVVKVLTGRRLPTVAGGFVGSRR
jgi:ATP-dependent Lhr-like helicase